MKTTILSYSPFCRIRCVTRPSWFAVLAFGILSVITPQAHAFSGGTGSNESPYQVASLDDLLEISTNSSLWNMSFIQTGHINAAATTNWNAGAGWSPIGDEATRFTGYYDGQGYTVRNLWINRPDEQNVGLFGHVGDSTRITLIQNLGVTNFVVKGARGSGSLIGRVTGNYNTRVEACYAVGCTVIGDGATGGLVGSFNSYIENESNAMGHRPRMLRCFAIATVSFSGKTTAGKDKFGGLSGCGQKGYIEDSYALSTVTAPGCTRVGGLVGCILYRGQLMRCYSTTTVSADGGSSVGGLVGHDSGSSSSATACFWDTETSGQTTSPYGTGLSTANMKMLSTFSNAGWDFLGETANGTADIWDISASVNNGYPSLNYTAAPPHRVLQTPLIFNPTTPQTYGTTNFLSYSGGSGTGAVAFSVVQGPGSIVNDTYLLATAGTNTIQVRVEKQGDDDYTMSSTLAYVTTTTRFLSVTGLTGVDKLEDGTTIAQVSGTPALTGVILEDEVSLAGTPVFTFSSALPGLAIPVTASGFLLVGEDAGNYSLEQLTLYADILPQPTRIRIE